MSQFLRVTPLEETLRELASCLTVVADRIDQGGDMDFAQALNEAIASSGLQERDILRMSGLSANDLRDFRSGARLPTRMELGALVGVEQLGLSDRHSWDELRRSIKKNGSPEEA